MKSRPKRFVILALFLAAVAISFPIQAMWLFGRMPWEPLSVMNLLTPINWTVVALCALSAALAMRASPWLFATLPLLLWLVVFNNWLVGRFAQVSELGYSMFVTILGSVAFAAALAGLIDRPMLRALLNPQARWWLTPRRSRFRLPLRLKTPTSGDYYLETFDISEGGAFIPLQQKSPEPAPFPSRPRSATTRTLARPASAPAAQFVSALPIGAQCYVSLPLENMNYVQCRAEVVRTTRGKGEYPAGVGIQFLGLSFRDRRMIQQFLAEKEGSC
jgi:hypothetical protein